MIRKSNKKSKSLFLPKSIVIFLLLTGSWYILFFPEYQLAPLLPIVKMGERSWPLYFFLLDALAIGLLLFIIIQLIKNLLEKNKYILLWLLFISLLIYPLINVFATYDDLTRKYCRTPECTSYIPGPDLKSIRLHW
jgi:hypothetical protein